MEELMSYTFQYRFILTAITTSILGTAARISFENETRTISRKKILSTLFASMFVAYLTYELANYYNLQRLTGIGCALGGLVSLDIMKVLIEEIPDLLRRKLNIKSGFPTHPGPREHNRNNDNGNNNNTRRYNDNNSD